MIGHLHVLMRFIDVAVITSCSAIDNLKDLNFAIIEKKMLKLVQTKADHTRGNFVTGDTATLLFMHVAHGNIAWYILQVA